MKSIGMVSLGCPKNLVDSEVMMGVLRRHGFQLTSDPEHADVVVVNTCGFIDLVLHISVALLRLCVFLCDFARNSSSLRRSSRGGAKAQRRNGAMEDAKTQKEQRACTKPRQGGASVARRASPPV